MEWRVEEDEEEEEKFLSLQNRKDGDQDSRFLVLMPASPSASAKGGGRIKKNF